MPTAINTNVGVIWNKFPAQKVFVKQTWAEDWAEKPYLYANSMAKRASPETSSAELTYDYGIARQVNAGGLDVYAPLALANWYVKIEVDQYDASGNAIAPLVWIGVITDRGDARQGAAHDEQGAAKPTGKQSFVAYGLEIFLEREIVRQSTVEADPSGNGGVDEVEINRPLGFNEPAARSEDLLQGNRTGVPGAKGAYVFAQDLATADEWSARDIVEYLLAYRSPKNAIGEVEVPFQLDAASLGQLADWNHPKISVRRESVKELIDAAISRKRLTGYYVDVDETTSPAKVKLYPFTFAQAAISVGASMIEANPNQVSLDFDSAFDIDQAVLKRTAADQYDQVIVRGGRKGSCFTLSFADGTLQTDWDDQNLETDYINGASPAADYPSNWAEQQNRNRLFRSADTYERVYAWFKPPASWNGRVRDGEAGVSPQRAFPQENTFDGTEAFYRPGMLFLPYLPLLTDHDYSSNRISTGTVVDLTPSGSQAERMRPLAFLKWLTPDGVTRYQHVEKMVETDKVEKYAGGGWHCSLRMQDRALGIELRVSGAPQHMIAKSDFGPVKLDSDIAPVVDYRDNLLCTVFLHTDHYLDVKHPDTVAGNPDVVRTLEIDYGEEGRLDYVAPNTVVGVADGKLVRSDGGYVRDDREPMRLLAEVAFEWYQLERQAFTLTYRQVSGAFKLGQLITEIGSGDTLEAVNTPITSIEWDLLAGTTTISTGFAALDVLQFSGTAPAGSIAGAGGGF